MKKLLLSTLILLLLCSSNYAKKAEKIKTIHEKNWININPDPNGDPWFVSNYIPKLSANDSVKLMIPLKIPDNYWLEIKDLPDRIDNSSLPFFRSAFNQKGGSCAQASGVSYVFTYEANWKRNLSSDSDTTTYPSHFTWNFLNGGKGNGSSYFSGWQIIRNVGVPNVKDYGGSLWALGSTGWMTGYDKYYNALKNKIITGTHSFSTKKEEGLNKVKGWLYNHLDTAEQYGGILSFNEMMTGIKIQKIPTGKYEENKKIVTKWGNGGAHAMTIVGYDDSVSWDFNGDGQITNDIDQDGNSEINVLDWEKGAWIIANSWGKGWGNGGFAYVPYRLITRSYCVDVVESYEPRALVKAKLTYSKRNQVKFQVGVSQNLEDTIPEFIETFGPAFSYKGGTHPLRGVENYEPLEVGLDLTELFESIDPLKPMKFFFDVITKTQTEPANGEILEISVISYDLDPNGIEMPCFDKNVNIINGQTTRLSVILPGNSLYPPLNLSATKDTTNYYLSWNKPQTGTLPVSKYIVYKNNTAIDTLPATESMPINYPIVEGENNITFHVTALYENNGHNLESEHSNNIKLGIDPPGYALQFDGENDYVSVPQIFKTPINEFSIEFHVKANTSFEKELDIGPGWGKFLFRIGEDQSILAGINNDDADRIVTGAGVFEPGVWQHFAITYKSGELILYKNGNLVSQKAISSPAPAWNTFLIGSSLSSTIDGIIDEFRIWNFARTQQEITSYMNTEITNPLGVKGLEVYYNFNETSGKVLPDLTGKHHGKLIMPGDNWVLSDAFTNTIIEKPVVKFGMDKDTIMQGQSIHFYDSSLNNPSSWTWKFEGGIPSESNSINPIVIYPNPGSYNVDLLVTNSVGKDSITKTQSITVEPASKPVANFLMDSDIVGQGNSLTLWDVSSGEPYSYEWIFNGADKDTSSLPYTSIKFTELGTHPVTLKVTNSAGTDSITKEITVIMVPPQPAFSAESNYVMVNDSVQFLNQSTLTPDTYKWIFEGAMPRISYEKNPKVKYYSAGTHDVTLYATNGAGTTVKTFKSYITVNENTGGNCLSLNGKNEYVYIDSIFNETINSFTIEFWINPESSINWNQQVGLGWGKFLFHFKKDGAVSAGIANNSTDRINSKPGIVLLNKWQHFAFSFDNGSMKLYHNGILIGSNNGTSSIQAWNEFYIGKNDGNTVHGSMDEFRLWTSVRSQQEIRDLINKEISDPENYQELLVYYDFNQSNDTIVYDRKNSYHGKRFNYFNPGDAWQESGAFCAETGSSEPTAYFCPDEPIYRKVATILNDRSSGNPTKWHWNIQDVSDSLSDQNPVIYYENEGKYQVRLAVENDYGKDTIEGYIDVIIDTISPEIPCLEIDTTINRTITVSYPDASDNSGIIGYKIFIDNVLIDTVTNSSYTFTNLEGGRVYTFAVTAFDVEGNETSAQILSRAFVDTISPSSPVISLVETTSSSISINFTSSTDNTGVTGYKIILDGVTIDTTTSTSYDFNNLIEGQTYMITVVAFDVEGNLSTEASISATAEDPSIIISREDSGEAKIFAKNNEVIVILDNQIKNTKIEIYNILGRQIISEHLNQNINTIMLNEQGIFIVKLKIGDTDLVKKISVF